MAVSIQQQNKKQTGRPFSGCPVCFFTVAFQENTGWARKNFFYHL